MSAALRMLARPRTYLSALFIATRFPLGLLYLLVLVVGLAIGLSGSLIVVGILAIVLTLAIAWRFAAFERHLVRWWLGVAVPPMSVAGPPGRSLLTRARDHMTRAVTWKSLLYLFLQFPAGLLGIALEVVGLSLALALTVTPAVYLLDRLAYRPGDARYSGIELLVTGTGTSVEPAGLLVSFVLGAAGVVLLVWVLWLLDQLALGWGAVASRLLGMSDSALRLSEARQTATVEHERAEQADQSRRELIVNVSHELRTPIASIRAHVETLTMREDARTPDPETTRYLAVISREVDRLSVLVDDLLALARADAGELKLAIGPVSVVQVVRHVYEALGPMARRQRSVTLVERLPDAGVPAALADPDRLTQVMMNLVRNAIAYTPEGGLVSIEAAGANPGHVTLAVTDTGIGIPPEDLARVFDRFYRTDASRARSTGGSGLGLSIARELVEAMGGTITAESQVDAGSRFIVRLRAAQPVEVA